MIADTLNDHRIVWKLFGHLVRSGVWPLTKMFHFTAFPDCPLFRWLFRDALLPDDIHIVGFARSNLTVESIRTACLPYMKVVHLRLFGGYTKLKFLKGF